MFRYVHKSITLYTSLFLIIRLKYYQEDSKLSYDIDSFEKLFTKRLSELRYRKNVSAREMSLAIGQNPGYINNIESGKALPSMNSFFYICDYLDVSPKEFFDTDVENPRYVKDLLSLICDLDEDLYPVLIQLLNALAKK